jgi:MOSC domain-containing protein YiiM
MARLLEILIASSPSARMEALPNVRAVPGKGLEGDRYYAGVGTFSPQSPKPDYELTLIESEKVSAFAASFGLAFTARDARRNLVTEGVDLNSLVGREFSIGEVRIRGIRLCEPCNYLAKLTSPDILRGLVHQGGLRAQILSTGTLNTGDSIVIHPPGG